MKLQNVLLKKEKARLYVMNGRSKYYSNQFLNFPVNDLDGKIAAEVHILKNLIQSVKISDTEIYPTTKPQANQAGQRQGLPSDHNANQASVSPKQRVERRNEREPIQANNAARAPYNFIPLNSVAVSGNGTIDHARFSDYSGYIELEAVARSPVFIRGYDGNFFRVNDKLYLPGSTLRGMTRQLVEVISYGKLQFFTDRKLYRRSSLTNDGNNVHAGFLKKSNGKFEILKATSKKVFERGFGDYEYEFRDNSCIFSTGKFSGKNNIWEFKLNTPKQVLPNNGLDAILASYNSDETRSASAIDLVESVNRGYVINNEGSKIKNVKIPESLGVPVFYRLDEEKQIISIGHAKYHRMPYNKSIGEHISQINDGDDFASILFGSENVAGKVYFEDLSEVAPIKMELTEGKRPKILSSPKPTSYQLYLRQDTANLKTWAHDNAPIAGWKFYWHKKTSSIKGDAETWIEPEENGNGNVHTDPINPIAINSTFRGRVRFDNLNGVELGLLLMALDLPDGCAHKLGMAKPLGLGSMRFNVKLTLIDRSRRYSQVFADNGQWFTGQKECTVECRNKLKSEFAEYMSKKLNNSALKCANSYWDEDERMMELKKMLTLEHAIQHIPWDKRTRYMTIDRDRNAYIKRYRLPTPSDIPKKETYNTE
jgi:hypothetical protein